MFKYKKPEVEVQPEVKVEKPAPKKPPRLHRCGCGGAIPPGFDEMSEWNPRSRTKVAIEARAYIKAHPRVSWCSIYLVGGD